MNIKTVFIGLALAFLSLSATAEEKSSSPVIVVGGVGEVNVEPDEIFITLRVEKFDKDLQVAKRLNDESIEKIMSLTRKYSIPARDIETRRASMEMVRAPATKYESEEEHTPKTGAIKGYSIAKTMVVKLSDIARFESFYEELLKTGLSEVEGVLPGTSRLHELKSTARTLAMKAAREKATAMAGDIGQSIGKAVHVTENGDFFNSASNSTMTIGRNAEQSALYAPGAITVRASVTISFELK